MTEKRLYQMSFGLLFVAACAQGSSIDPGATSGASSSSAGGANGSSSSGDGGSSSSGAGGMGTGGMGTGGMGTGGMGGAANGSSSSSSSSSSSGWMCGAVIVDWNWSTGMGPTNLTYGGPTWSIGTATEGPKDGLTYLATVPDGNYSDNVDDWVQLPTISLSSHINCRFRTTVELWRNSENVGLDYDGGNLQYTLDPATPSGWTHLNGAGMNYDGVLSSCDTGCIVKNQETWASSSNPKAKIGVYEGPMPGPAITFRFTFHSDSANNNGRLPGLYIKRVLVESF